MLAADEKVTADRLERFMLMGELSLDGSLQPIKGVLPMAIKAREHGLDGIIARAFNQVSKIGRSSIPSPTAC